MTKATKKKVTRAKQAATRTDQIVPTYLQSGSVDISLHDVIEALKMIEKHGHLNKLSRNLELEMNVPADTVDFIKDFIVKNDMYDDQIGRHIVNGSGRPAPSSRAAARRSDNSIYQCYLRR